MSKFQGLAEKVTWFPGHMFRGLRLIRESIQRIDLVVEVRDARLPVSSRNIDLDEIVVQNQKQKLVLFNKFDLCNQRASLECIKELQAMGTYCLTSSAETGVNIHKILLYVRDHLPAKFSTVGTWMLIAGMPNVGKSTVINALRRQSPQIKNKSIAQTAPLPCITKSVVGFKVSSNPLCYVVDSPGVMVPNIIDDETALKLGLIGCIRDKIIGPELLVEYLLYLYKEINYRSYLSCYGLSDHPVSAHVFSNALRQRFMHNDLVRTYDEILGDFREGKHGKITLDKPDKTSNHRPSKILL
jgi:mitochondrial GTPase 1